VNILLDFISSLLFVLLLAIVLRSILSWFPINPNNPFVAIPHRITEPIFAPLRRVIPKLGMMDLTPMAAMLTIWILLNLVAWWNSTLN